MVVPLILGEGKYLFNYVKKMNLELFESITFDNGLVLLKYKPA